MQSIEWRPVVGCEGCYEVSNRGDVRSVDRTVLTSRGYMRFSGRMRALMTSNFGHLYVHLSVGGVKRQLWVHRLVLMAFVGLPDPGQEGCHNNGNPADNRLENLRWDTHSGNIRDIVRHGTRATEKACRKGHEWVPENTYVQAATPNARNCRTCGNLRAAEYRERKRNRMMVDQ